MGKTSLRVKVKEGKITELIFLVLETKICFYDKT